MAMSRISRRPLYTCPHCKEPLTRDTKNEDLKDTILRIVSETTEIDVDLIYSRDRHRPIVFARHLAMSMLYNYWMRSVTVVGQVFNQDHTTVLNGLRKIQDLSETEPETKMLVDAVKFQVHHSAKLIHHNVN